VVKEIKAKMVEEIAKKIKGAKTVAIANIGRIPSKQFQEIRKGLRGKAEIKVVKKRMLIRALEKANLKELTEKMADQPALIISELNPFELFREMKARRSPMPAKPGMIAEKDIVVPAGGTGLPPGPAIGDLQMAGIPAKIEKGQIVVLKEKVVTKAGEEVTPAVANALNKIGITPFEVGLEITGAWEAGLIFGRDVLDIDYDRIRNDIASASESAFNLAYHAGYPVKEVIEVKLTEASGKAMNLALNIDWVSKDTIKQIISKAHAHALALNARVGGG